MLFSPISRVISISRLISMVREKHDKRKTYISTITSTNNQTTIQHKLHVRSSTSFCACCRDMLADITCRANHFSLRYVVVLQEDDLQKISNIFVVIYNRPN